MAARNLSEIKAAFLTACKKRGVDPETGATGYQVVELRAEQRRAAFVESNWWKDHELWLDSYPHVSTVEHAALWNIFSEAYSCTLTFLIGDIEQDYTPFVDLPLRDLHARRGEKLVWVELENGRIAGVIEAMDGPGASIAMEETVGYAEMTIRQKYAVLRRMQGETYAQIAEALDEHSSTITYWVKNYFAENEAAGIALYQPPSQRVGAETRAAALEMHAEGRTPGEIAHRLGISKSVVRDWIKKYA